MTKEVIFNVEEFIKSLDAPLPLKSIHTYRNTSTDFRAPKFLTEAIYEDPKDGKLYSVVRNTLKIARLLVSKAKYEKKRAV